MKKERRGIQSVEVGGQLLEALVSEGAPMLLRDLAQKAGMTSAKAHPYLVSLGNIGLIQQDSVSGRYELGPFALQMGLISLQLLDPVKIALAETAALCEEIGHTVALAVLGNCGPTIVHLDESRQPIHVKMRTGTVMSILNTATGRVFSAYLPAEQVARLSARELGDPGVANHAGATFTAAALAALLAEVRGHGMARTVGDPTPGINAISAPVFDHAGKMALAVTAIGPMGSLDAAWDGAAATRLKECAARISRRLGHKAGAAPAPC
ncbi:IclR family transcriptional regulator [Janthinobacterium sp.]|uniref:IclR family transcriptional regulator n=1 Tax=Janthinobacterium sp. TaxID=1871054 RepID=UPI00293D7367|nr:IclR family transcriptional regulator [Janthinobacterium sp.]